MHQANDTAIAESGTHGNGTGCLLPTPDPELKTPCKQTMSSMQVCVDEGLAVCHMPLTHTALCVNDPLEITQQFAIKCRQTTQNECQYSVRTYTRRLWLHQMAAAAGSSLVHLTIANTTGIC